MNCNDEAVLIRAQQGDRSAFGLLVQRYQDRVYRMALNILHQQQDAQDAAQQAFLQAWQKRQTYNPRWRFSTWLYRIVTNICIDEYRRQQRRPRLPDTYLASLTAPHAPAHEYERHERCQALTTALGRLPVEARIVLVLCYMEGLSYGDIARVRGISTHTVKSQLRRGKALLRQRLQGHDEETP
ncbi:ECF RNA polymerase sigma factor SigE [Candidatus Entotheonellaceae bacterium PAL068K]